MDGRMDASAARLGNKIILVTGLISTPNTWIQLNCWILSYPLDPSILLVASDVHSVALPDPFVMAFVTDPVGGFRTFYLFLSFILTVC